MLHQACVLLLVTICSSLTSSTEKVISRLVLEEEPEDVVFLNTMQASLTCHAGGYPRPDVVWLYETGSQVRDIENVLSVEDDQLKFHAFNADQHNEFVHEAKYRCKVSNTAGTLISRLATVKAEIDQPYSPMVHHEWGYAGASAIFTCDIPANVASFVRVFEWLIQYPGKSVTEKLAVGRSQNKFYSLTSGQLVVKGLEKRDEEFHFSCVTRNMFNNATMTNSPAKLFVSEDESKQTQPNVIVKPSDQLVQVGDTFVLNCQCDGKFTYKWLRDNREITSLDVQTVTGGTFRISNAQPEDGGLYKCIVSGGDFNAEYTAKVEIQEPLLLKKRPSDVFTKAGGSVSFRCSVGGTAPYLHTWRKDGRRLSPSNKILVQDDVITVFDVRADDEGIYQCVITNKYESIQTSARLVVDGSTPVIESFSKDNEVALKSPLKLQCVFNGHPSPVARWYLDDLLIPFASVNITSSKTSTGSRQSELNVNDVTTRNSGKYSCHVENYVGYVVACAQIEVSGPPTIIGFKKKVFGVTRRPLSINCHGKGYPQISYRWFRKGIQLSRSNNVELLSNGTIHFKRFARNYMGTYWCEVENSHGVFKQIVEVAILEPPRIQRFHLQSALMGLRTEFFCTLTQGSSAGLRYAWYKDGVQVSKGQVYLIEHVQRKDRGRYTCVAENSAGKDAYSDDFTVYEEPSFIRTSTETLVVMEEHPVVLHCSANGFPRPQITWFKRGLDLLDVSLDNRVRQMDNGSLYIGYTRATDNGTYVCQATFFNADIVPDPISKQTQLIVRVPPRIVESSLTNLHRAKGDSVRLYCSAVGSFKMQVRWFKNSQILMTGHTKYMVTNTLTTDNVPPSVHSTLLIKGLMQDDNGGYQCHATNAFGINKKKFTLFVEEEPKPPTHLYQDSSTSRSITLSWRPGFDGNSLITGYRVEMKARKASWNLGKFYITRDTHYAVGELQPGTAYSFRASATNRHGVSGKSNEATFVTKEEEPSGPPQNITVVARSKDQLYVSWQLPLEKERNGEISAYKVHYVPTQRKTVARMSVTVEHSTAVVLQGLLQYTAYHVTVQAATAVGFGPQSLPVPASTMEGVPSLAPPAVLVKAMTSQALSVSWQPVPEHALNGILLGYKPTGLQGPFSSDIIVVETSRQGRKIPVSTIKLAKVFYTEVETGRKKWREVVNTRETQLGRLRKYALYQVGVLAYTKAGDGVQSQFVYCRTQQDVPGAPHGFSATPASPTEIGIAWAPPLQANGIITNYVLYYREVGLYQLHKFPLPKEKQSHKLQDLKFGQEYAIWMTAKTVKGEGKSTDTITTSPKDQVASKIITPPRWTTMAKMGSDIDLPCVAVGHPKPVVTWTKTSLGSNKRKQRRFMANDRPYRLFNIQEVDEGTYNCTATNKYGSASNTVTLIVQVPPKRPHSIHTYLIGEYSLNVTWLNGYHGNSPINSYHVRYAVSGLHQKWQQVDLPSAQRWYTMVNLTKKIVYFQVAAKNDIGLGMYSHSLKLRIAGNVVIKTPGKIAFARSSRDQGGGSLRKVMQPVLITLVAVAMLVLVLLLVASWDREEKRMRRPSARRLLCASCKRDRNYNSDPYGEPALPWPWNLNYDKQTSYTDDLDQSNEQIQFNYTQGVVGDLIQPISDKPFKKGEEVKSCSSFDFQPAVRYKRSSKCSRDGENIYSSIDNPPVINYHGNNRHCPQSSTHSPTYQARGAGDGKSLKLSPSPTNPNKRISPSSSWRRNKSKSRRDETLADIEEKKVLDSFDVEGHTSPKAALQIQDYLDNTSRSYDSLSSTCSSSVGELKRAFEFGKRHGLQDTQLPAYDTPTSSDSCEDPCYEAHEKLLEALHFSALPRDMNDTKVRIPLPVRLTRNDDVIMRHNDVNLCHNDVMEINLGDHLQEQSLV